ncbi:TlpA family protein disulfide reductase [Marinilongibacter aquaticus]|uniref:TlpA family protein disulfide reductase n=1 Tax=Marinilongibacter aquaticus TaxID=2975157 RepID=UPI0021BDD469|nr:TlpA disulfide reductase family protein [Marinilongibacter aquaticus]UBM57311.1 TlpA family protein disulfide reductase [Marinilongibacter aquaticus]
MKFERQNDSLFVFALNGEESLQLDNAHWENDSLHISMELFDAVIVAAVDGDQMRGRYEKKLGNLETRAGTFTAQKGELPRFVGARANVEHQLSGKWATTFTDEDGGQYEAIGVFDQEQNNITGSFLTTTGDYRYLQGNIVGDSLMLSCFDGTHIFLFKARIHGDTLTGNFSSSLLYKETWRGIKDEGASLPDPESLTFLKDGYNKIAFNFPDSEAKNVSLSDTQFQDKVVLVQILGSWCPNCMDESRFLAQWQKENPNAPVEIVGLAFEKKNDPDFAFPKIEKMKARFGLQYPILLAGDTSAEGREKALPMLNHIMSFPTMIYIDKQGLVRKIHTGFSGPGTGEYYQKFTEDFDRFVQKLIAE